MFLALSAVLMPMLRDKIHSFRLGCTQQSIAGAMAAAWTTLSPFPAAPVLDRATRPLLFQAPQQHPLRKHPQRNTDPMRRAWATEVA